MTTALITHSACLGHVTPAGHPERVARLEAVLRTLDTPEFQLLERMLAPRAEREDLLRVHTAAIVDAILGAEIAQGRFGYIDGDTSMSFGSAEAALRAAGAVTRAVDEIAAGRIGNAFCAVRPPGHHAERNRAMGFCLFNNVAIGALHARAVHGLVRGAVVDFDVHHGNGTQDIFFGDPDLLYASTHQSPLYPGTGSESEKGVAGNVVNAPLAPGSGSSQFRAAFDHVLLPALEAFRPEFIFISAGFDAHRADPLAELQLDEEDFGWATRKICEIAGRVCRGRVVSALEGGYDLDALGRSAAAHVRALMEA
ncbi:MAG: histone deacetylase family protein [Rhizomicrobium sp.]|jgi:acetoin utilization deacetylase AcuC-like enzyme